MDQPVARHLQRSQRYIDEGQYAAASVVLVDYAEFTDTERLLRRVCAFCALPYEAQCLDASLGAEIVATPSSQQVREPVRPRMGAWQPYREYLGVLRDGLAAWPHF